MKRVSQNKINMNMKLPVSRIDELNKILEKIREIATAYPEVKLNIEVDCTW